MVVQPPEHAYTGPMQGECDNGLNALHVISFPAITFGMFASTKTENDLLPVWKFPQTLREIGWCWR